jgi:glutaredoxin
MSRALLKREGFEVEDHHLKTREQTDAFKQQHNVESTPQTFIEGKRIGGYEDLRRYFGKPVRDKHAVSYKPVVAVFGMVAALALATSLTATGTPVTVFTLRAFVAFSMCLLAVQKLRDLDGFATMFLGYDLLARRWVRYAWLYPFGEALAGVLMLAGVLHWVSIPLALFIGSVGAVSVFYAVYIQKRELKCACTGANSNVPLGFVSLTENLMMVTAGLCMLYESMALN